MHWVALRRRLLCLILFLLTGWAYGLPVAAQEGFTHGVGGLIHVDLATDGSASDLDAVGETGVAIVRNMAVGPDDMLYAIEVVVAAPERLHRIDPATAESVLVGDLDPAIPSGTADMTFDDAGQLWLLGSNALYQVDPETAVSSEVVTDLEGLAGLGFYDGVFYSLRQVSGGEEWELVALDPTTGDVSTLAPILGINEPIPSVTEFPTSLTLDATGGLWINVTQFVGGIDPPDISTLFLYLQDPLMGDPGSRTNPSVPGWYPALAVRGPVPATVEIPTLGRPGVMVLALGLGLAAVGVLRRRSASSLIVRSE